jgi:hypothetical protein
VSGISTRLRIAFATVRVGSRIHPLRQELEPVTGGNRRRRVEFARGRSVVDAADRRCLSFAFGNIAHTMSSASDDDFPPDYGERIERVCCEAAAEFRSCRDDLLAQVGVCCHYFESGEREGISHEELIDFLGISSPSVLDRAGYSNGEAQRVMESLVLITYDNQGRPRAPTSLPSRSLRPPPEQSDLKF